MIIVAIIALSGVVLVALYAALVGLPSFPAAAVTAINNILTYFGEGIGFLFYFTNYTVVRTLIYITLTFEGILMGYKFVMWVAKKIPMFGVSD